VIRHLLFRCPKCRSTTNVKAEWVGNDPTVVSCSRCQEAFTLPADRDRALSDGAYRDRIRKFAAENKMDLASACSVVEGIMGRDRVRALPRSSPEIPRPPFPVGRAVLVTCALLVVAGVLRFHFWSSGEEALASVKVSNAEARPIKARPKKLERPPIVPVVYQMDMELRLTRVIAPDPPTALLAFCTETNNAKAMIPYALAPAVPPSEEAMLGVVRDRTSADTLSSVKIWLDQRTGRWTIGSGAEPIPVEPLQGLPDHATLF
jgi:predicted Zn finger-like uncharacterized protein